MVQQGYRMLSFLRFAHGLAPNPDIHDRSLQNGGTSQVGQMPDIHRYSRYIYRYSKRQPKKKSKNATLQVQRGPHRGCFFFGAPHMHPGPLQISWRGGRHETDATKTGVNADPQKEDRI